MKQRFVRAGGPDPDEAPRGPRHEPHHGHHDHHGHGRHEFGQLMKERFGRFGGPFGEGRWPGGPRARRGDMKFLILEVIAEKPMHGYDVIRALEERRDGHRPSAGSVYPTLQMLEDAGYVDADVVDGKRVFTITESGRAFLATRTPDDGDDEGDGGGMRDLRGSAGKLAAAIMQVARERDTAAAARARAILDKARKDIYALLAEAD